MSAVRGQPAWGSHVEHTQPTAAASFESWRDVSQRADATAATVTDVTGTRYSTSEHQHQLIIERPSGERHMIGRRGTALGELLCPRGLAVLPGASRADTRIFVCDAWNHRIQIFDGEGVPRGAFGRRGSAPGRFDVPTAITVVAPVFAGEELDPDSPEANWLAVADRWNHRVQIFDLDGWFIGAIGNDAETHADEPGLTRAGWPFFRVGTMPVLSQPVKLLWVAPRLVVTSATGRVNRLDLALALLPDFDSWRRATPADQRAAAARRLLTRVPPQEVLPESLRSMVSSDRLDEPVAPAAPWQKAS